MEDFTVFRNILTESHPSLYRYQSKATIDSAFQSAAAQISGPLTADEFWRILSPVIVSIRSGHTELSPSNAETYWERQHPVASLPPFFYARENKIWMLVRKKGATRYKYVPVKQIDRQPADQLLHLLKQYTPGEARSDQWADYKLQAAGFSTIYGLVLGYKPVYNVVFTDSLGTEKSVTLKAQHVLPRMSADQYRHYLEDKKDELNQALTVTYPPGLSATAVLKIRSFTYLNYYLSFHEEFFKLMQQDKIENLVIDLRGNNGGFSKIGLDLMRYLVRGRFTEIESEQVPANKITFNKDTIKTSVGDIGSKSTDQVENYRYQLRYFSSAYPATEYHFDKRIYVLTDQGTFSAASIFVSALRYNARITVIGEETGGAEAGSDGAVAIIKLPNTGLLLFLPRYYENTTSKNPRSTHGLIPEIIIKKDMTITQPNDPVMDKAKELINAKIDR